MDSVNQQAQGLIRKADAANRQAIENSNGDLNKHWSDLAEDLKKRRDSLQNLADNWDQLEDKLHALEKAIERLEDKFRHVDSVVRSRRHLEETKNVIQVRNVIYLTIFYFGWLRRFIIYRTLTLAKTTYLTCFGCFRGTGFVL